MERETKGSGDTEFPVLDSRTSGPHVCSHDVLKECEEVIAFLTSVQEFFVQTANQKNSYFMSPEPFFSLAKASPAKRSDKGYGDENVHKQAR